MTYQPNIPASPEDSWTAENYRKAARLPTVMVAILVAFSMMFGILGSTDGSVKSLIIAPMVGAAIGLGLGIGWHVVQKRAVQANNDAGRLIVAALVAALLSGAMLTSVKYLATFIAAGEVVKIEQGAALADAQNAGSDIAASRRSDKSIISDGETATSTFRQLAIDELENGAVSGASGPGQTYDALIAAERAYSDFVLNVQDAFDDREMLLSQGFEHLSLAEQASRTGDEEAFEEALRSAQQVFSQANSISLSTMLGSLSLIETRIARLPNMPDAADQLRRNARRIGDQQEYVPFPRYQPIAPIQAMTKHFDKMLFAFLAAGVIECIPAIFTFLILTAPKPVPWMPVPSGPSQRPDRVRADVIDERRAKVVSIDKAPDGLQ